jgi:tetratricopeptide (TPR) repeat protein
MNKKTDDLKIEKPKTAGWIHLISILIIVVLVAVSYANALQNEFIWDDEFLVRDNLYIRSFSHVKNIFTSFLASSSGNRSNFYRPIQDLSYMVDYFLWGYNPMGFHLTNIILHAACAALVYLFIFKILSNFKCALLTGALFGIHPINTEAVTYVAGRADSLYLFFFLLSFILFLKVIEHLQREKTVNDTLYILSLASYTLSILSKEIAVILPIMLFLYHKTFVKDSPLERKIHRLYIPYIVIFGIYVFLRKTTLDFSGIAPSNILARFDIYQRMLTASKVIVIYLRLLILPIGLHMERTVKIANSLMEPAALGAVLLITVMLFYAWKAYKRSDGLFFFSAWFFIGLIPVSNIVPINSFIAEHWLYLPAIGIFAIAGIGIIKLSDIRPIFKAGSVLISIVLVASYAYLTMERNRDWKDEIAFFKNTLRHRPNNSRLHLNFGNTYAERGMLNEAIKEYKKAVELRPNFAIAYGNIGSVYLEQGRHDEAKEYIEKALKIKPDFPDALYNLGMFYENKGDTNKAEELYRKSLKIRPDYLDCHIRLSILYLNSDRAEDAKRHWREILRINPRNEKAARLLKAYSR